MYSFAVFDLETTIKSSFKRKANPFNPENYVVLAGAVFPEEKWGSCEYFESPEEWRESDWFINLLASTTFLVGFNIKFDIHHCIQVPKNYAAWMQWVSDGGQIWDCQLAEYLLNGMGPADQYLALDEVAPRYGGNLKVDEVKEMWEAGIDTPDIPRGLLERYLVGDPDTGDEGDLGNTRKIFRGQAFRARKSKQAKSIVMNMGSLLFTIEAEHNGMRVDKELGLRLAKEREEELAGLTRELESYLPDDLPFEFNWGSRHHLSALIFGGTVKYKGRVPVLDEDGNFTYPTKTEEHVLLEDGTTREIGAWQTALDLGEPVPEALRFASGKRKGEPKTKKVKVEDKSNGPKTRLEDLYYTLPGFTQPSPKWATKTEGVYSTSAEVLELLGNRGVPFLDALSTQAAVRKDLGTYFLTTDPKTGAQKGMLTLVDEEGFIHHSLNHVNTVTGRFSSSNPNLQNLSKKGKSKVKSLFISRYGKDGKIIQSDFTSLEIFIQAVLTSCPQLIEDLAKGLDMHCLRVSQKERIPYEEAVRLCKGEDGQPPDPEWKKKRDGAKEFSFQRAYGAGIATIAEATGMDEEEVRDLALAESSRYPEIDAYFEEVTRHLEENTRPTGSRVPHPDFNAKIVELGRAGHRTPDGKLYTWRQHPAPRHVVEREGKWATYSPPEIKNYEVQGGGAEWMKAAMYMMVREFYRRKNWNGLACIVNTVHDASYTDAHNKVALEVAAVQHVIMELASAFMEAYFGWPQPVHVPSDTSWGASMIDEDSIHGLEEAAEAVRSELFERYITNIRSKK